MLFSDKEASVNANPVENDTCWMLPGVKEYMKEISTADRIKCAVMLFRYINIKKMATLPAAVPKILFFNLLVLSSYIGCTRRNAFKMCIRDRY